MIRQTQSLQTLIEEKMSSGESQISCDHSTLFYVCGQESNICRCNTVYQCIIPAYVCVCVCVCTCVRVGRYVACMEQCERNWVFFAMYEQECDCTIQNYNYGLPTANRYHICSTRDIFWVSFGFASVYFLLFPKAIV